MATSAADRVDAICLSGLSFYAYHGVAVEERSLGQRFVVDVRLELDLGPAGRSDNLELTVDYAELWQAVSAAVQGPPLKLLESVGERVAATILDRFERVGRVWVRLSKPGAPIAGASTGAVAVELTRERRDIGRLGRVGQGDDP